MTFIESVNLKKHVWIHTGEKTYKCKVCEKLFAQSANLKHSIRKHTGEKHTSVRCVRCLLLLIVP